ncbi:MAG TPA: amino acid permease, partial [Planctomycetota bacterium]|nr:amino acid permease [Planctomycetota bacterium]
MTTDAGRRRLSLFDATMLVMGGVIGVGIFFTPGSVAQLLPTPGLFFGAWLLGGLVALAGAMTFAELAASFPHAGGWYVYLREAFGRLPAFLFAWIVLLVVSTGAAAVVADFCAQKVAVLLWGLPAADGTGGAPPHGVLAIGAALLVGLTLVSLAGVKSGALLQNAVMLLKLGAIAALAGAALLVADAAAGAAGGVAAAALATGTPSPAAPSPGRGLVLAMLPVLFSYGGWQLITYIAPLVRDPQRTLPRAIVLGMLGVVAVYLAMNLAFVKVLGLPAMASEPDIAARLAHASLGSAGGKLLVAAMAVSALGICAAIVLASPFLYVAMAEDGLFFRRFGKLSPRTGAPVAALLVQGAVALLYLLWVSVDKASAERLTDSVVFAEWIFHAQCGAALLLLRRRRPELSRP